MKSDIEAKLESLHKYKDAVLTEVWLTCIVLESP